jgi:hypothetical protein
MGTTANTGVVLVVDSVAGEEVEPLESPESVVSVDATVARGGVWLERLDGRHVVEAERIDAVALAGDVTAVATLLGVDLDLRPAETCFISVDTTGGATLRLPRFGAYDLVVETDPEAPTDVADIGFDEVRMAPGRVTAWRSPGSSAGSTLMPMRGRSTS